MLGQFSRQTRRNFKGRRNSERFIANASIVMMLTQINHEILLLEIPFVFD
jgi:hypothetical protein